MDSSDADVRVGGQAMGDDEFMAIVAAYNEDGTKISVNDDEDPYSIYTVSYNQLQIPLVENNSYVSVIYRTNPKLIEFVDAGGGAAGEQNVPLPVQLLDAVLHYIGYRAHGAIDGSIQAETNTHFTRFVAACNQAAELGIITADDTTGRSVQAKGWV